MADEDKRFARHLMGKIVVSKTGKRFGEIGNLTFETRTGEILQIILKNPTAFTEGLELEQDKQGNLLVPYSSVLAIGDFVVISEEDIL